MIKNLMSLSVSQMKELPGTLMQCNDKHKGCNNDQPEVITLSN